MNELYFDQREFIQEINRTYQRLGFNKVDIENSKLEDYEGDINIEAKIKNNEAKVVINYNLFESKIFIHQLKVAKKRKGVGTKIVSGLEDIAQNFGFKKIELIPDERNLNEATLFWEHLGYISQNGLRMIKLL
jgi:histone acetyltransferase (RNA polymerase elongator complex component)